jgi:hypothetical protein
LELLFKNNSFFVLLLVGSWAKPGCANPFLQNRKKKEERVRNPPSTEQIADELEIQHISCLL